MVARVAQQTINIYAALPPHVERQLDRIERKLNMVLNMEATEMADLTRITSSVAANGDAEASAIALLNELSDLVRANATDPAALNDLATTLDQQASDLAAAVVANTPASTGGGTPPPPPFVAKLDGETYADYVARVDAWNADPTNAANQITAVDEPTWTALPVG